MANKTQPTHVDPLEVIHNANAPDFRKADGEALLSLITEVTGATPVVWGDSLIGFGRYTYLCGKSEEQFFATGMAVRKANLVCYVMPGYQDLTDELSRLGKHKIGKGCLYLTRLEHVDLGVLKEIIQRGVDEMNQRYQVQWDFRP
ncbi:DUF1801 domain-containing protein [Salinibius halmophilus]|uniref:DUF1801 domain-containing protein n=1 Tax=Salinibius halmophilus TaxID=1853216 RepID=UPI000E66E33D|nr:DUF1801 domain-containing protein [Salinibius halmophilus]